MTTAKSQMVARLGHASRDITNEEEIDFIDINTWKSAQEFLNCATYRYKNSAIKLEADWNPLIRRMRRELNWARNFRTIKNPLDLPPYPGFTSVNVPIALESIGKLSMKELTDIHRWIVEAHLHDHFLIMNIATPGSCEFGRLTIPEPSRKFRTEVALSALHFDIACADGRKGKWPAPRTLPVQSVAKWLQSVRNGLSQVPQNRMEKVLFAILHIAKISDISPVTVIWIFYALETIFDTKAGENFRALVERITLLLSPTDRQLSYLKKDLRKLYDIRSSFVHGGLEVVHPMFNDALDQSIEKQYERLMQVSDFGFRLLLCSVQEVVVKGWRCPEFEEKLRGQPLPS